MILIARDRSRTIFVAMIVLLLAIVQNVHAGGRREDRLPKADQLISERRYNEAILALTAFIKENPERFDEAQRRLQRIVRLRDEYNLIAGELLDVLVNDPTNDERKLAMIKRLEDLETTPNRAAREFLSRTKDTALFTFNRAQFDRIMAEGRALIDARSWADAAKRYATGFTLYRDQFDEAAYGQLVVSRVLGGLGSVQSEIGKFDDRIARLETAIAAFEAVLSQNDGSAGMDSPQAAYDGAEAVLLEYAAMRNAVAAAGRAFETQFLLLQGSDKDLGESSFLPFAYRFVLGRKTEIRPEGVLGAMDTLWIEAANRAQTAAIAAADRSYARALSLTEDAERESVALAFDRSYDFAEIALKTIGLWSSVAGVEASPVLTSYGRSIVAGKPPAFLRYRTLARASRYLASAARDGLSLASLRTLALEVPASWDSGTLSADDALARTDDDRRGFLDLAGKIGGELDELDAYARSVDAYRTAQLVGTESAQYLETARSSLKAILDGALAAEGDAAVLRHEISSAELERVLSSRRDEYAKALALLQGEKDASGATGPKFPAESIPFFVASDTAIVFDLRAAAAALSDIRRENERISTDPRIIALDKRTGDAGAGLATVQASIRTSLTQARERVSQAAAARQEGDRRYEEARSALTRLNFDLARERLQRSGERYDLSLSIQESASLRADRDRRLLALSAEISKTENEVVVRDVRRLITQAKSFYFSGSFDVAEDSLIQAQNRWRTTNVEDESEVAYWLTLVRGALSIKTGRTIPKTAPLYAEMSQLLSFALRAFDEGKALLAARRKTEALARFEEAKSKLQTVRIVFPINQEAGLLELRIDQLIDPDAFNAAFRRKVTEAQAKMKASPQEAYSELQDLAEINPRFPGLKAAIEKAEIDLGLRLPPPDTRSLTRSDELVRAARRIVDANTRSQFPVALEQLNEALRLNPNNEQAVTLKDRIQTDVGGLAAVVLTSASEKDYQRAVQELQQGNTIVALAIVEQLLQDPRNKNSPRILELQRRIQARL